MQNHEKSSSRPTGSPPLRTSPSSSLADATPGSGVASPLAPLASSGKARGNPPLSPVSRAEPLDLSGSIFSALSLGRLSLVMRRASEAEAVSSAESGALGSGPPSAVALRRSYRPKNKPKNPDYPLHDHGRHVELARHLEPEGRSAMFPNHHLGTKPDAVGRLPEAAEPEAPPTLLHTLALRVERVTSLSDDEDGAPRRSGGRGHGESLREVSTRGDRARGDHRPTKWDTVVKHVEQLDLGQSMVMERVEVKVMGKANEEATESGE